MKNKILSVIAGITTGWIIVAIADIVVHSFFPLPQNFDYKNKEALKVFAEKLPNSAFIMMIFFWAISVFSGGLVTGKIAKENWQRTCLITGVILLIATIGNLSLIPHPIWVKVITVLMYLPLAYLGAKIVNNRISKSN
ncbi:MAG: hypothetical protein V4561_02720 [Bacteroidota bacterium]